MAGLPRDPFHLRIVEIDDVGELADVRIAIADEVDEGLDIERERGRFERHGAAVVREIIVAIDKDGAALIGADDRREALGGEIGERQVDRALDMAAREGVLRARVEEEGAGLGGLGLERVEGDEARRARGGDAGGERLEGGIVDLRVGLRQRGGGGGEGESEKQGAPDDPPLNRRRLRRLGWLCDEPKISPDRKAASRSGAVQGVVAGRDQAASLSSSSSSHGSKTSSSIRLSTAWMRTPMHQSRSGPSHAASTSLRTSAAS